MKSKLVFAITMLFFVTEAKTQNVVTKFKDAQAISLATNKPILIKFKKSPDVLSKFQNVEYYNVSEINEFSKNFVILELLTDKPYSNDVKFLRRINNFKSFGGNVIDPLGNTIGNVRVATRSSGSKSDDRRIKKQIETLKYCSYDLSLFQEDYRAVIIKDDVFAKISLIEKYLNYSLYLDWYDSKREFIYVAAKYLDEFQNEKTIQHSKNSKEKLNLLNSYRNILNGKYRKAIKSISKLDADAISEANKSLYFYIRYVANNKVKNKEIAKVWLNKLKERKDFNKMYLLSKKI